MNIWEKITKPVDKVLDSNAFKAVMPVQALGQEAVRFGTGLAGMNAGRGITPSTQYAIGGATGTALGAGSAMMGPSPAPGATSTPTPAPSSQWENHAPQRRHTSDDSAEISQTYHKKYPSPGLQFPTMRR